MIAPEAVAGGWAAFLTAPPQARNASAPSVCDPIANDFG